MRTHEIKLHKNSLITLINVYQRLLDSQKKHNSNIFNLCSVTVSFQLMITYCTYIVLVDVVRPTQNTTLL